MSAETIAKALGGRKAGGGWLARCPVHDDGEPSLSMRNGGAWRALVHCHAGCEQERVIAVLHSRGLWEDNGYRRLTRPPLRIAANDRPTGSRRRQAQRGCSRHLALCGTGIWHSGRDLLRRARSACSGPSDAPLSCRAEAPFGRDWPGMIAVITRGGDDMPLVKL